ncbi:MAG: BamA/TamA family outer membrane protein [Candidatus Margulisbacteria bacterium]|nr:BamA/TamA family outer membrane protein [Candidatus Margulisiibacteriota bacterium]
MNFKIFFLAILISLGFQPNIWAQSSDIATNIVEVNIKGLRFVSESVILKSVYLTTQVGQKANPATLLEDSQNLYLTGYFNSVAPEVKHSKTGTKIHFNVSENPIIKTIVIRGAHSIPSRDILSLLHNKVHQILNIKTLKEDKKVIETLYENEGYILARVTAITITNNVLSLIINEGIIEQVDFMGLKQIKPFLVHRALRVKAHSVYNIKQINRDRQDLLKLGYFTDISNPAINYNIETEKFRLSYFVHERKVNLMDIGLEHEEERMLGFFKINFNHMFIHSDHISLKTQLLLEDSQFGIRSYSIRYFQPWILNKIPVSIALDGWTRFNRELFLNTEFKDNKREGFDMILGIPLHDHLRLSTKVKRELVSPENNDFSAYTVQSLSGQLSFSDVEDWFNPKRGSYATIIYEHGINFGFLNDINILNFNRYSINSAKFWKVSEKGVVAIHGFAGVYDSFSAFSTFETEGFEVGGANSLRGYKETNPLVGSRKLLFNLEYRRDFSKWFQGVLFFDIGNADNVSFSDLVQDFKTGSGFGFRFFTAVGPIRTDIAWGQDLIIHFNIGQAF